MEHVLKAGGNRSREKKWVVVKQHDWQTSDGSVLVKGRKVEGEQGCKVSIFSVEGNNNNHHPLRILGRVTPSFEFLSFRGPSAIRFCNHVIT